MKKSKLSILFLLTLIVSLFSPSLSAQANTPGKASITIENATIGKTYSGFKLFSASYSSHGSEGSPHKHAAYTLEEDDEIAGVLGANNEDNPNPVFNFSKPAGSTHYNVTRKEGVSDEEIVTYLQSIRSDLLAATSSIEAKLEPIEADTTTVTWKNADYGYYLITDSEAETAITVTNLGGDVTVIDKNQGPGFEVVDPNDPNSAAGKTVSKTGEEGTYTKSTSQEIGEEVHFKIKASIPKYRGNRQVASYTFTDTMAQGLSFSSTPTVVIKNGQGNTVDFSGGGVSIEASGQTVTITVDLAQLPDFPTDASIEMNYTATVNENAVYINQNTVEMAWQEYDRNNPNNEYLNQIEEPSTATTYVHTIQLQKYEESVDESNRLFGAEFELYDVPKGGRPIKFVETESYTESYEGESRQNYNYRKAVATDNETTTTLHAGSAQVRGFDGDKTYYLLETKAPDGFNRIENRIPVTFTQDNGGTYIMPVINNAGVILPETGGMGTGLIYIIGGVVVVLALSGLVIKRKKSQSNS